MPFLKQSVLIFFAFAIGITGAVIVLLGTEINVMMTPVIMATIPAIVITLWRPRLGVLGFLFLMLFMEEFPGGIGGEDADRSARTPFYSITIGIPAVYIPDILLYGLLLLFLLKYLMNKEPIPMQLDKIGVGLLLILFSLVISILVSYAGPETFGPAVLGTTLGFFADVELPENIARLISILQIKLFIVLFPSYLLGLFYFRKERDLKDAILVFTIALTGTILLALARLFSNPNMIAELTTVIVDTASVWLMCLAVFYIISLWTLGYYRGWETVIRVLCCTMFVLLILISFRRTLWGAMAVAALFWPLILPRHAWNRLFFLFAVSLILSAVFFSLTPIGQSIILSVIRRAGETTLEQGSTLYRFALLVWFFENLGNLPFWGYGLRPLWDVTVQVRLFLVNMESVHSLYLWILLRMGVFGMFCSFIAGGLVMLKIKEVYILLDDEKGKILVGVIFLSLIMFSLNGIANPVYGQVRHMVLLGLELAIISRLPYMLASSNKSSSIFRKSPNKAYP